MAGLWRGGGRLGTRRAGGPAQPRRRPAQPRCLASSCRSASSVRRSRARHVGPAPPRRGAVASTQRPTRSSALIEDWYSLAIRQEAELHRRPTQELADCLSCPLVAQVGEHRVGIQHDHRPLAVCPARLPLERTLLFVVDFSGSAAQLSSRPTGRPRRSAPGTCPQPPRRHRNAAMLVTIALGR